MLTHNPAAAAAAAAAPLSPSCPAAAATAAPLALVPPVPLVPPNSGYMNRKALSKSSFPAVDAEVYIFNRPKGRRVAER